MRFYPQLDGLRFLFIFMVLAEHWGPYILFEDFFLGGLGVDLFFVLSGFLIGEILFIEKNTTTSIGQSLKNFYVRRFLRIFPLYYISLAVYGALVTTGGILIWNLTYTTNIQECIGKEGAVIKDYGHLWSLCVEEQFYLLFPFFLLFTPLRKIKGILWATIVGAIIFRFCIMYFDIGQARFIATRFMVSSLDCLFAGVLLAYFKTYQLEQVTAWFSNKKRVTAITLVCLVLVYVIRSPHNDLWDNTLYRVNASILGVMLIGYSTLIGYKGWFKAVLENRYISAMGKVSYGIYMLHAFVWMQYERVIEYNPVRNWLIAFNKPVISNRYIIDFIFLFSITVGLSFLSYHLMEKRFLRLKKHFT